MFLCCEKPSEGKCGYFQWVHEAPKPVYVPKTATCSALKKRFHDMVNDRAVKRVKVEELSGRFMSP